MRVIKFEPIEIYRLLIIFHYMNTKYLFDEIQDIWVVIHLSQVQMSQYMLVICFISIYFNFFEKFLGYNVTNSIVSIYHIKNSIVSTVHDVLCTSGSAMGKYISTVSKLYLDIITPKL